MFLSASLLVNAELTVFLIIRVDARWTVEELQVIKIRLSIFVLLSVFLSVVDVIVDVDFICLDVVVDVGFVDL